MRNSAAALSLHFLMDILVISLVVAVLAVGFYAALRAYARHKATHGGKPSDTD